MEVYNWHRVEEKGHLALIGDPPLALEEIINYEQVHVWEKHILAHSAEE